MSCPFVRPWMGQCMGVIGLSTILPSLRSWKEWGYCCSDRHDLRIRSVGNVWIQPPTGFDWTRNSLDLEACV